MNGRIQDGFIYSAAVILFVTGMAKIMSANGTALSLDYHDPIVILTNRQVFYMMGGFELMVSAFLLIKNKGNKIKLSLIAWLASNLLIYRAGLWWMGAPNLCDCMGNLNETLAISPRIANSVMLVVLSWLFVGSYMFLIIGRCGQRKLFDPRLVSGVENEGMKA